MWEYKAIDPSGNELQHWKYIRKYRTSSGKWRYVYADRNLHNQIQKYQQTADVSKDVLLSGKGSSQQRVRLANKMGANNTRADRLISGNTVAKSIKTTASKLYNKGKSFVEKIGNITLTTTEYSDNGKTVGTSEFKIKDLFKKK